MIPIDVETVRRTNRSDVPVHRGRLRMQDRRWGTAQARRDDGGEQSPASNASLLAEANLVWHYKRSQK